MELGYYSDIDNIPKNINFQSIQNLYPIKSHYKRNKRWDASYTCGWPLAYSDLKLAGDECEFNSNNDNIKTCLNGFK